MPVQLCMYKTISFGMLKSPLTSILKWENEKGGNRVLINMEAGINEEVGKYL